jgi:thiamine-monophosphate kinase
MKGRYFGSMVNKKRSPAMPQGISENRIIQRLQAQYPSCSPWLKKGIGDDAAVIRPRGSGEYWVITTDMLLEGIDFRCEWTTPRQLGHKSIAVNLSDLAAMGARPRFYTVSLAMPQKTDQRWIDAFYAGLAGCGQAHGAMLIGGDLSSSHQGIMISITALGESLNRKVVYRAGGRPGDLLYVTGTLGGSAAGLKLLQAGTLHPRSRAQREALRMHHMPEPRCRAGLWLAQSNCVRCMMDISDGLSMDLSRLCAAGGVDAEIRLSGIPVFSLLHGWNCGSMEPALHGGEDYELLFAVPPSKKKRLEQSYPPEFPAITLIGTLIEGNGAIWISEPGKKRRRLPVRGFDHFKSGGSITAPQGLNSKAQGGGCAAAGTLGNGEKRNRVL